MIRIIALTLVALTGVCVQAETFYLYKTVPHNVQGQMIGGAGEVYIDTVQTVNTHRCIDAAGKSWACREDSPVSMLHPDYRVQLDWACGGPTFTLTFPSRFKMNFPLPEWKPTDMVKILHNGEWKVYPFSIIRGIMRSLRHYSLRWTEEEVR